MTNQENNSHIFQEAQEDEIDLRQVAETLMRRKKVIFGVALAALIAAFVVSLILPKTYEIKTALEIGEIVTSLEIGEIVTSDTKEVIENPAQLQGKIEQDLYGPVVRQELDIGEQDYPKIKVDNLKDTNTIFISASSSRVDETKKIFEKVNESILNDHEGKLGIAKKESESRIEIEEKNIERLQNKIQSLEQEKTAIEGKIAVLQGLSIANRDAGIQFALFDNKEQLENKIQEVESLYQAINSSQAFINSLQRQIEQSKATAVIQEVSVSEKPVSPRPLFNVILATILGLFAGILWVLANDWWNNTSKRK